MKLFGKKSKPVAPSTHRVNSNDPTPPRPLGSTSNAYIATGGGNIDFGSKAAARAAQETRDLLEAKKAQAEASRIAASASHQNALSSNQVNFLQQPGSLAVLNKVSRVDICDLDKPAWANAFIAFGADSRLMETLNKVIDIEISRAEERTEAGRKTLTSQAMRDIWDFHIQRALTMSQIGFDRSGATVSMSHYRDPVTHKVFIDFTVPTSSEEKSLWEKQLLAHYGSFDLK